MPVSSLEVAGNWDGGVPPSAALAATYDFAISREGDYAKLVWGNTQGYIFGAFTVGAETNPNVTMEFISTRGVVRDPVSGSMVPDNSSPACFRVSGILSLLGSQTTIKIGRGFCFGTRGDLDTATEYANISPAVTLQGDGIFNYGARSMSVWGLDYDNLWLQLGQEQGSSFEYQLKGDMTAINRLMLFQGGTGGVGGRSLLNLNGHTAVIGDLKLGTEDNRPEANKQSSFGGIVFNGGTLKMKGSLEALGDPDGTKTDGTPLVNDHLFSTAGNGGVFEAAGSLPFKSRSAAEWYLRDLALVLNGDGTEQALELLTEDVGDTPVCLYENTVYGSVTVKAGAVVRMVDDFDNDRRTPGTAEALYTMDLTVEEGATLDLNGYNLYVCNAPAIAGNVLNGTVIRLQKAGFFSLVEHTLGTPGESLTGTLGQWVGPMVAGDFDKDGKPELAVLTMDENLEQPGSEFHLLDFDGTALTEIAPFPFADTTVLPGRTTGLLTSANNQSSAMVNPFMFEDLGDGKGTRLIWTNSGYSDVIAMAPDGQSAETLESACSYGNDNFILVDLDGDRVKDIVTCYRNTGNLRAWSVAKNEELWRQTLTADASIVVRVGVADLNGDRTPEVMAVTKGAGGASGYNFHVFNANGTAYKNADGDELTDVQLQYGRGEGGGALIAKDVTGDGVPEIFIVDTAFSVNNVTGYLLVIDQKGETLFFQQSTQAPNKYSSPNVQFFDMDGDRVYEFLYDGAIYNGKFEKIDQLPVPTECRYFCALLSPAMADLTGDQVPEIIYGCTDPALNTYEFARWIVAYDPVKKAVLSGFPIKLQYSQSTTENDWHAGSCQHWNFANIIVADLDGDKKWEIVVGIGVPVGATPKRAALNVIKTPYGVEPFAGRTEKDIGAWQYGRGPLMDFSFPFAKKESGFLLLFK